jgi:hypothetical protein
VARFYGTNKSIDGTGNLQVFTSNSQSTNNGGTIGIGGMNGSAGAFDPWAFATLKGAKENSTSSNLAGYLAIATSSSGGTISERMRIDSSGNLLFNSGYGSVATAYGCRAWVNFSGATPTVNASGNVSSVTKQSTGNYTINFTNSMPDTNYAVCGTAYSISVAAGVLGVNTPSTGNCTIQTVNSTNAAGADFTKVSVAIFR